jgi:hypothetical protein
LEQEGLGPIIIGICIVIDQIVQTGLQGHPGKTQYRIVIAVVGIAGNGSQLDYVG